MSIIIFVLVLAILIFVHELGHFLAAKGSNVRVDEFGLGFPPRAVSYRPKNSETRYSLNWLPLGGFVKIFGEDPSEEAVTGKDSDRSMISKSKPIQVWILAAGVLGNLLMAWLLISIGFAIGLPASTSLYEGENITDRHIAVTTVLPNSPAEIVGLERGDRVLSLSRGAFEQNIVSVSEIGEFIGNTTEPIVLTYDRNGEIKDVDIAPVFGILEDKAALGVGIDEVGTVTLPVHRAFWEGGRVFVQMTGAVAVGLWTLLGDAVTGNADLSQVTGPVGLVGLVGQAGELGFVYLLSFTALISINLALINLLPFPALDGGRILFVIIEVFKGSPIKPKVANVLNTVGFALLILLMIVVTYNDIANLISL